MREILFRGKTDDGKWKHGSLTLARKKERIGAVIVDVEDSIVYGVIPETVGQYTGLRDKNGKMIFEGDVFKSDYFKDGREFEVVFSDGAFCGKAKSTGIFPIGFQNDYYETGDEDDDFYYPEDYASHVEIIDNVFDGVGND